MKHIVKTLKKDTFIYRGKIFRFRRGIPNGQEGRYVASGKRFTSRAEVKEYIDGLCVLNSVETLISQDEVDVIIKEYKDLA